ncbi:conserved hypothetical protein [Tenacibaculum sp. 190130A14a]|uniref:hypothetical protein n=1 Tax=Tenacibaculum polynesiense TaxID=3137857 RepID=UPI0032001BC0
MKVPRLHHLLVFVGITCYGQNINLPKVPNTSTIGNYNNTINTNQRNYNQQTNYNNNQTLINSQRSFSVYEQDRKRVEIEERRKKLVQESIIDYQRINILELPSYENTEKASSYKKAFEKLLKMNVDSFSIKEATFTVENAFYEEKEDYKKFNDIVKRSGSFLKEKMKELNYPPNSNLAKNLILFQFFADTLEIKSKDLKHLPLKYDFEDYKGQKNWNNMFVSKLLKTGKGQCHSMPLLYLILAEEIGAKAHLSLSPNHSYIKFQDDKKKWYNIELTNGMFTTDTYILQSGYITSEALQRSIYMQELSSRQLLSHTFDDLASGYIRKFGYDGFAKKIIDKSLELYPENINANIMLENYLTYQFEYVTNNKLGINPRNHQELQKISTFPQVVKLLNTVNNAQRKVDDLGYKPMPAKMYQAWLASLKKHKQQQDNDELKKQFKLKIKTLKN